MITATPASVTCKVAVGPVILSLVVSLPSMLGLEYELVAGTKQNAEEGPKTSISVALSACKQCR